MLRSKAFIFTRIVNVLIIGLSVSFVVLMFASVINRYFLRLPIPWSLEILKLLFVWLMFIAGSAGVERDSHVGVKWLENRLSPPNKKALIITRDVLLIIFLLVILSAATRITWHVYTTGQLTGYLRAPYTYWYLAMPIGFILMLVALLIRNFSNGVWRN